MKRRRSLFLVALLCFVATVSMADSVTLRWISWWGEDTLKPIAQGFEKTHPNIKIEIQSYPFDAYFNKVQADMAAKTSSIDILAVDAPSVAEYTVRHYVLPMDKYFTKVELTSSIASAVLDASYYKGTLSALPTFSSNHVLYYNPGDLQGRRRYASQP